MPSKLSTVFSRKAESTHFSYSKRSRIRSSSPSCDMTEFKGPRGSAISLHSISSPFDTSNADATSKSTSHIEVGLNDQVIQSVHYDEHGSLLNLRVEDGLTPRERSCITAARSKAKQLAQLERNQPAGVTACIATHIARQKGDYAHTSRSFGPQSRHMLDQMDSSMAPDEAYNWLWEGAKDWLADSGNHEKRKANLERRERDAVAIMVKGMAGVLERIQSRPPREVKSGVIASMDSVPTPRANCKWRLPLDPAMVNTARSPLARKYRLEQWERHWRDQGHTVFSPPNVSSPASVTVGLSNCPHPHERTFHSPSESKTVGNLCDHLYPAAVYNSPAHDLPQQDSVTDSTSPSVDDTHNEELDQFLEELSPAPAPLSSIPIVHDANPRNEYDDEEWLRSLPRHPDEDSPWVDLSDSSEEGDEESDREGEKVAEEKTTLAESFPGRNFF
jgi:hypothetical protein